MPLREAQFILRFCCTTDSISWAEMNSTPTPSGKCRMTRAQRFQDAFDEDRLAVEDIDRCIDYFAVNQERQAEFTNTRLSDPALVAALTY